MRRAVVFLILIAALLAATGCMPHTTGETEVGVRTRKLSFFGEKGLRTGFMPRGPPIFPAVYQ